MPVVQRKSITPRPLSAQERAWIKEILEHNPRWADAELIGTQVVAECGCGKCRTVYLDSPSPQNPSLAGTKGYIGRIEIRTVDDFGITITLDQKDGQLGELYVDPLDLIEPGNRMLPDKWQEKGHTVTQM
jgi:hypothetical protein